MRPIRRGAGLPAELSGGGRFVLRGDELVPAARRLHEHGRLRPRVQQALALLEDCGLCPRECRNVRRLDDDGKLGACRIGRFARVVHAGAHHGEEDALRGWRGSGTVFLAGCALRCAFCQNAEISQQAAGRELPADELAAVFLDLQRRGCHNLNLVTPGHVVPQLLEALLVAVEQGLDLPVVANTGGYESPQALALLDGVIDVYLPDVKTLDADFSRRHLGVVDYPEVVRAALGEMHRQVGVLRVDEQGIARRGVLVRHLVMHGGLEDSREVAELIAGLSPDAYVNVMGQYRPAWRVVGNPRHADIDRPTSRREHLRAVEVFRDAGLWRLEGIADDPW